MLPGLVELGSLTALPLRAQPLRAVLLLPLWSLFHLSLLSGIGTLFLPLPFPGGDDWASGGAISPVFAQPFAGDERILQVWPPLLFPSAVRDGAPQTLTKLFVFGSESSYNILPTNFDFFCMDYRVYMCTPMSYAGYAPAKPYPHEFQVHFGV